MTKTAAGVLRLMGLAASLAPFAFSGASAQEPSAPQVEPLLAEPVQTAALQEEPSQDEPFQATSLMVKSLEDIPTAPRAVELSSELPSGNAVNDRIFFTWYPATSLVAGRSPALVLVHPLGRSDQSPMHQYARYFAKRGIACAVLTLPYHGHRLPKGDTSIRRFVSTDTTHVVKALQQSVADVRTVTDWMAKETSVDSERLGIVGISIGAIITHLAMGQDARLKAGVAALGGADFAESYRNSPIAKWNVALRFFGIADGDDDGVSEEDLERLSIVDPLTYADQNLPRRVLMVQAARDVVISPRSAETLWKRLGKPPIQWIDTNHFAAINMGSDSTARAATAYLKSVWNETPLDSSEVPSIYTPSLKAGFVMNLDSIVTPAVQWQFLKLGTYQHRSLFSLNAGMSGRGPFVGLAATVTSYFDLGVARRLKGEEFRPYASLHFVY